MKILYLSEDYVGTMVHHNLCNRIIEKHEKDVEKITLYCYTRYLNTYLDIRSKFSRANYEPCVQRFSGNLRLYKYIFIYKIRNKYTNLKHNVDLSAIDVVHASTLFSEGALAYKIYKEYGIPYTVGVRGTDIQSYLHKQPHLWFLGYKILKNASKIIYISAPIKEEVENSRIYRRFNASFINKGIILPNGIDEYWHEHSRSKQFKKNPCNLLYIGRFDSNKNVESLLDAVLSLRTSIPNIHLTLVGGGANRHDQVVRICQCYPDLFTYLGKIYDKEELSRVMRQADAFVMVSHSETFGLVYIEALSQGLPIIYTKGEGIDGYFSIPIGEGVNSYSVEDIANGIKKVLTNYTKYRGIQEQLRDFSWDTICEYYLSFFKNALYDSKKNI